MSQHVNFSQKTGKINQQICLQIALSNAPMAYTHNRTNDWHQIPKVRKIQVQQYNTQQTYLWHPSLY